MLTFYFRGFQSSLQRAGLATDFHPVIYIFKDEKLIQVDSVVTEWVEWRPTWTKCSCMDPLRIRLKNPALCELWSILSVDRFFLFVFNNAFQNDTAKVLTTQHVWKCFERSGHRPQISINGQCKWPHTYVTVGYPYSFWQWREKQIRGILGNANSSI